MCAGPSFWTILYVDQMNRVNCRSDLVMMAAPHSCSRVSFITIADVFPLPQTAASLYQRNRSGSSRAGGGGGTLTMPQLLASD